MLAELGTLDRTGENMYLEIGSLSLSYSVSFSL